MYNCLGIQVLPNKGINERSKKDVSAKPYVFTGFNNLRDAHYRLWNPVTERVTILHDATFVETKLTRHWYENLLLGEDINFSGGDHGTLDINDLFDPIIPTDFQSEATNSNDQIEIAEEEQYPTNFPHTD